MVNNSKFNAFNLICTCTILSPLANGDDSSLPSGRDHTKVLKSETLSEIAYDYLGSFYSSGYEKVLDLYTDINKDIKDVNKLYPNQIVLHPNENEIRDRLGPIALKKYLEIQQRKNREFSIVKEKNTLSDIIYHHIGAYYSIGPEKLHKLYTNLNKDIRNPRLIYPGQKIFHPTDNELELLELKRDLKELKFRKVASAQNTDEANNTPKTKSGSLQIELGAFYSTIDGENLISGSTAELISSTNTALGVSWNFETTDKKSQYQMKYLLKKYSILPPVDYVLKNPDFMTSRLSFSYLRNLSEYGKIGATLGIGQEYFQRGVDLTTFEFYSVRSTNLTLNYKYSFYESDQVNSLFTLDLGINKFNDPDDSSLESGTESKVGLQFIFPRNWGNTGVEVFVEQNKMESDFYKQTEKTNGALIFFNMNL